MPTNKIKKSTNFWFFSGHSIGVTLLGIHALQSAREEFSTQVNTRLYLILTKKTDYSESLLRHCPHISVIYFDRSEPIQFFLLIFKFFLKKNHFMFPPNFGESPLAVQLFAFMICRISGRGKVIAFTSERKIKYHLFYSHKLPLNLLRNIFAVVSESWSPQKNKKSLLPSLLFSHNVMYSQVVNYKYIVLHPFGSGIQRTYPARYTKKLCEHLVGRYPGHKIILSGGPADKTVAELLIKKTDCAEKILFIEDMTKGDFSKKIQIISGACLYIGVDTGVTHMAAHLRVPTIVLGNRSNPMWLPNYSKSTIILTNPDDCTCTGDKLGDCYKEVEGIAYYRCMVEIPWQTIVSTVNSRLHD